MRASEAMSCEATCAMHGRHTFGCVDHDACRGCLPRLAVDGLRLCPVHVERISEDAVDAPILYDDLALVLVRRGKDGEKTSGSASGAPVPDEDVMEARAAIRSTLIQLTKVITWERGLTAPTVVRNRVEYVDTSPIALGAFIVRHATWLAAHRSAGRYADLLHEAVRGDARRIAYPSGSDRMYVGDCPLLVRGLDGVERVCGTRLYQAPDQPLIQCGGCDTDETVEQWQKWIVGETSGVTDAYAVAAHLALRWMRPVDPALIRQWSHRGHIHPVMEPDPTDLTGQRIRIVTDHKGRTQYDIGGVVAYAESIWGPSLARRRA